MLAVVTAVAAVVPLTVLVATLGHRGIAARVGTRSTTWWSRRALGILDVRREVEGAPRGERFLVAANHLSYLDIWMLGALYPSVFVAKREIAGWPLFGAIARVAGTLFVDRDSPRDLVRVSHEMTAHLERGLCLTLFPEGKATHGERVLPFMPSLFEAAARAGVPCYAASLTYDAPGSLAPPSETVCWWGGQSFLPHLLRLLRLPRVEARLRFAEVPIRSSNRKELARRLHEEVVRGFVPVRQSPLPATPRAAAASPGGAGPA